MFLLVVTAVTVWWHTSAKKWFKGPRRTIDQEIQAAEGDVDPPTDSPGPTTAPA